MPAWKVLVTLLFAVNCLALALSTLIIPMALSDDQHPWLWLTGLILGTVVMGTLFTMFLRHSDKTFKR